MIKNHFHPTLPNLLPIGTNQGAEKLPTQMYYFYIIINNFQISMMKNHFYPTLSNFLPIGTNQGAEKLPEKYIIFIL